MSSKKMKEYEVEYRTRWHKLTMRVLSLSEEIAIDLVKRKIGLTTPYDIREILSVTVT